MARNYEQWGVDAGAVGLFGVTKTKDGRWKPQAIPPHVPAGDFETAEDVIKAIMLHLRMFGTEVIEPEWKPELTFEPRKGGGRIIVTNVFAKPQPEVV